MSRLNITRALSLRYNLLLVDYTKHVFRVMTEQMFMRHLLLLHLITYNIWLHLRLATSLQLPYNCLTTTMQRLVLQLQVIYHRGVRSYNVRETVIP